MELTDVETDANALRLAMAEAELKELLAAETRPIRSVAWENYVRCFFLLAVVSMAGYLAWKPGMLRFSMIMTYANPSRGESLAWRPDDIHLPPPPEIKRQAPPAEWRLGRSYSAKWNSARADSKMIGTGGGKLVSDQWPRFSANPRNWRNDAPLERERPRFDTSIQPPQKPASSFRVGDIAAWPDPEAQSVAASAAPTPAIAMAAAPAASGLPLPPLPQFGGMENGAAAPLPLLPPAAPGASQAPGAGLTPGFLPPLGALEKSPAPATVPLQPPAAAIPADPVVAVPSPPALRQPEAPAPAPVKAEPVDWKNREITGPIPDAYLTVYPKLKFIGLCVPGQGYVRKYNQVAVPRDLTAAKSAAQDGKTPYGRYYIADRRRDADGPRLFLSWPSPEDAQRIGLDPGRMSEVVNAWRRQELPPQNTSAGGGVGLNGLRNWVETTEGGFSLEMPDMEEIYTALPDKAWVFIQPN